MAAREPYARPAHITINTAHKMMEVVTEVVHTRDKFIEMTHRVILHKQNSNKMGEYIVSLYKQERKGISQSYDIDMMLDMRDTWTEYVIMKTNEMVTALQEQPNE